MPKSNWDNETLCADYHGNGKTGVTYVFDCMLKLLLEILESSLFVVYPLLDANKFTQLLLGKGVELLEKHVNVHGLHLSAIQDRALDRTLKISVSALLIEKVARVNVP